MPGIVPSNEELRKVEVEMISRHADMYNTLMERNKEVDRFERKVKEYMKDVRHYDEAIRAYTEKKLHDLGEDDWHSFVAAEKPSRSNEASVNRTDLSVSDSIVNLRFSTNWKQGAPTTSFILNDIVSNDEADALIKVSEAVGYRRIVQNLSTNGEQKIPKRTNLRAVIHSDVLAKLLWPRVAPFVPKEFTNRYSETYKVIGLNSCMRFCKYEPGQLFAAHTDDVYTSRDQKEKSFLTLVIYLNEGFSGGQFRYLRHKWSSGGKVDVSEEENVVEVVAPHRGMGMIFQHDMLHEGMPPTEQPKYLLRTDVVYYNKNEK